MEDGVPFLASLFQSEELNKSKAFPFGVTDGSESAGILSKQIPQQLHVNAVPLGLRGENIRDPVVPFSVDSKC